MELVGNPIRNPLERLEGKPRLFDLPVNSHLDDERRLRGFPGDRPEPVFESEGYDVQVAEFAGEVVDVLRVPRADLAVPVEVVRIQADPHRLLNEWFRI